ncbi:MAG: membrane protein insertase YidC [Armatimonadetes bacterium]|nr:membrane protein insertase YidC [Armatimonadota bacterium]
MHRFRSLLFVLAVLVGLSLLAGCMPTAPKSDRPLSELQAEAKKAESAKKYDEALRLYETIAASFPKTESAGKARLQAADILFLKAQAADKTNPKEALHSLERSRDIYRDVQRQFADMPTVKQQADARLKVVLSTIDGRHKDSPLYKILDFFVALTGRNSFSYALAIIMITLVVKGVLTPFTHMQYKAMRDIQRVQPKVKELQEKYKGRPPQELNQRLMALYKEEKVSPFSSCLMTVVQIPVLWLLYSMIRTYEYQFSHGTFLWIGSPLHEAFPKYIAANLSQSDIPMVILYGISMYFSMKLTPAADPAQAEQQKLMAIMMPVIFTIMFLQWNWPSAFLLYWLFFNIVSTYQQWHILKQPVTNAAPVTEPQIPVIKPKKKKK